MKKIFVMLAGWCVAGCAGAQNPADSMALFFKQHPKTSGLYLINNDSLVTAFNAKTPLAVAGMSDLLVAFEFAKQAAYNALDTAEKVYLSDVEKYYLPGPDGGGFTNWTMALRAEGTLKNEKVSLLEIANGMMQFGSLANTDYLLDRLGFDNIRSNLQSLNMTDHSAIVSPMGSWWLYQNPRQISNKRLMKEVNAMDEEAYCKAAYLFHRALKHDSTIKQKYKPGGMTPEMLQSWSDRLPNSTAVVYGQLMQQFLAQKVFDARVYDMLRKVLDWPMQYAPVQKMFSRFTMKGSATPTCFTQAQYGITPNGNRIVLVYICDDLTAKERQQLAVWHQGFETKVFTDSVFREQLKQLLK
jgi:D-alanyl-D-alanine carboxypeptidase